MPGVVDADSHVYEPPAVWDDFVPAGDRARVTAAFHHTIDGDGNQSVTVNGRPGKPMNRTKLVRQAIWRPGMTLADIGALDPAVFHPLNPGASEVGPRLADMDALGIDQAIVYPTLFNEYLPQVTDLDAVVLLARAYNDWIAGFAAGGNGRLHPVAVLPLQSPDLALEELERVAGMGMRAAMFRPAFYPIDLAQESYGRQMTAMMAAIQGGNGGAIPSVFVEDKPFRPLWERAEQLGVVACVHPSLGITGADTVSSGAFADRVSHRLSGVSHTIAEPIAYMQDADLFVTAALFHGLLEDHPDLRIAIAHSGATWVPLALEKSETYLWLGGLGSVPVCLEPEEVWDRHPISVSFDSWELPVARRPDTLGSKAAWGSRYPHHDTGTPAEARQMLEEHGVDAAMIEELLSGHCTRLFGLAVDAGV
jgi:predicted TIM-barrel fold metal-dependent hydrolase